MAYEIIALDMDGTLLDSRKRVLASSVDAIERAAAAGKTVAICSGRCPAMVTKYRDELPGVRYAICCAGAVIYDMERDRVVDEVDLDPAFVAHALDVAEEEGPFLLEITSGTGIYMQADEMGRAAACGVGAYESLYHETATVVEDAHAYARKADVPQSKLNFHFEDVTARDRCRARLEGDDVVITNAERSSMEFSAPGVDKGVGLARLAELLGVDASATIAVGDAENDLSMLRSAGLGVAMGNALPCAVEAADVQVADNDHDGVAEAIGRYLLA
mgnify:CR=1 FL=1